MGCRRAWREKENLSPKILKGQGGQSPEHWVGYRGDEMSKDQALKGVVKPQEAVHCSASTRKNSMGLYLFPISAVTDHNSVASNNTFII